MTLNTSSTLRPDRRGFTLIELLTVVAIIVLLIGILVPAFAAVRKQGKATATSAAIGTLSTGLEQFRADLRVGGSYAPSASDHTQGGGLTYRVNDAYNTPFGPPGAGPWNPMDISGAGLLVWALAGADLLGTPGFKTFRSTSNVWARDTDAAPGNPEANSGAYALRDPSGQPIRARATFVDTSKVRVTRFIANATTSTTAGSFEIEAEKKACDALGIQPPKRSYPMFLDGFGHPILYWRADPAGIVAADSSPNNVNTADERGIYHYFDNAFLLADSGNTSWLGGSAPASITQRPLVLSPTSTTPQHRLNMYRPSGTGMQRNFVAYSQNKATTAKVHPQKADSFLLVSPGDDGLYGTGDDITNFEQNGAALSNN